MSVTTAAARFQLSKVAATTFRLIGRNGLAFSVLSALFVGAPTLLVNLAALSLAADSPAQTPIVTTLLTGLGAWVVLMVGSSLLQAGIIHGVIADLNGRKATLGEMLKTAAGLAGPLMLLGLIQALGTMAASVAFLIPGLIVMCVRAVAIPARVVEGPDWQRALGRSADLTRGRRWPIFGMFVLLGIGSVIVQAAAGAGLTANGPVAAVIYALVQVAVSGVTAALLASLYYELRLTKEGIGAEQLAAVFD